MSKSIKLSLILLMLFSAVSATPLDTLKIYYNINQKDLINTSKLDSLIKISDRLEKQVNVIGYADFLGTSLYNQKLALQRSEFVKRYLLSSISDFEIIAIGKGEVVGEILSGPQGDQLYRRVDVVYNFKKVAPLISRAAVTMKETFKRNVRKDPIIIENSNLSAKERISSLPNLNVGEAISLDEITFKPGRHYLRQEAVPYLVRILKVLKKNPLIKIDIQGHICCESDGRDGLDIDEGTVNLSVNRARFIYDYFIQEGISADRLSFIGLGSSKLKVFPEVTSADEVKNRRVVFMIVSK